MDDDRTNREKAKDVMDAWREAGLSEPDAIIGEVQVTEFLDSIPERIRKAREAKEKADGKQGS